MTDREIQRLIRESEERVKEIDKKAQRAIQRLKILL